MRKYRVPGHIREIKSDLYRLGIKVDYGGMDERYAMNKTIASRLNDPCSVIAALR